MTGASSLRETSGAYGARFLWAWFPVGIFLAHRISLLFIGSFGLRMVPGFFNNVAPEHLYNPMFRALCRWDCGMYLNIATRGYVSVSESPVFPFYPMVARGLATVTGLPMLLSLVVVANVAGLGALVVIYRIFSRLGGEQAARWGLALFVAFPFAWFHAAGYAESLAMFFVSSSILLALDKKHVAAGVMLALGCGTRHIAILGGLGLLAIAIQQRGLRPTRLLWHRDVLGLLLPFVGLGAYAVFCYVKFHHPLAFALSRSGSEYGANRFWHDRAWWSFLQAFRDGRDATEPVLSSFVLWSVIPLIGAFGLLTRRAWHVLAPYALVLMALFLGASLMGLGRFSASCWPAFLPLGAWLSRRPALSAMALMPLAMAQGFYFYLWSHWFGIF